VVAASKAAAKSKNGSAKRTPNRRIMLSPFSVDLLDLATYNTNFPLLHYT
jgi:hypothetical protein